jgi:formiminoglutamase
MSGASSSAVAWYTRLEPAQPATDLPRRPDDPRLGEIVEFWRGDPAALRPGRAVLIGFPQDEGVRRNGGRVGAAEAPGEIRRWLYRLTPGDPTNDRDLWHAPPLDAGNVQVTGDLESSQQALAEVVAGVLASSAIPVVLGGGHETAYGHYLGLVAAGVPAGIVNFDAHLDVRPLLAGLGHSGSSFRQALEHPTQPLPGSCYYCLGLQPHSTSRKHLRYAQDRGCIVHWAAEVARNPAYYYGAAVQELEAASRKSYVTIDADVVCQADVPGVSAPNSVGLSGAAIIECARLAGASPQVAGMDIVEINPRHDRDGQSARWAALVVWTFLVNTLWREGGDPWLAR